MTIENFIEQLNLIPHPEGGYYKETLRVSQQVCHTNSDGEILSEPYSAGTSIYYLLGSQRLGHFSAWHRINNQINELWNYHAGSPLTIYCLHEDGTLEIFKLGLIENALPQIHIPTGCWFAAEVEDPNPDAFTLVGCVVFPGFEFKDFELADRTALIEQFPQHKKIIEQLTHPL